VRATLKKRLGFVGRRAQSDRAEKCQPANPKLRNFCPSRTTLSDGVTRTVETDLRRVARVTFRGDRTRMLEALQGQRRRKHTYIMRARTGPVGDMTDHHATIATSQRSDPSAGRFARAEKNRRRDFSSARRMLSAAARIPIAARARAASKPSSPRRAFRSPKAAAPPIWILARATVVRRAAAATAPHAARSAPPTINARAVRFV
jgi:hypothetical protein